MQGVQQNHCVQFCDDAVLAALVCGVVAAVDKFQRGIGKAESIQFTFVADALYHSHFSVGYQVLPVQVLVLRHHHHVASSQFAFIVKDSVAYAHIVDVGTLVAACYHYGAFFSASAVALLQCLYKFIARHYVHVRK